MVVKCWATLLHNTHHEGASGAKSGDRVQGVGKRAANRILSIKIRVFLGSKSFK